ncbi:MAG: hypothetical protein LIP10_01580 [Clostridiales bacterium]|nr:hypothetical protein [Clostridiales bacterium]
MQNSSEVDEMGAKDLSGIDIRNVKKEDLVDMRELEKKEKENPEAVRKELNNPQNWRLHRRGDVVIENSYTEGKTINELFAVLVASS